MNREEKSAKEKRPWISQGELENFRINYANEKTTFPYADAIKLRWLIRDSF